MNNEDNKDYDVEDNEYKLTLSELKKSDNVAELLSKEKLYEIACQVVDGYEIDEDSRIEWKEMADKVMKLYAPSVERKDEPWENASNIKYPLIADAAIGYCSKTLPEIIKNEYVVKTVITGADPNLERFMRGERVSKFMSYQALVESPDWQDSLAQLLSMLSVVGTVFKKTYQSPRDNIWVSDLCVPDKICVNYATKSLDTARRITHIITLYGNDIIERQRTGVFSDCDLDELYDYNSVGDQDEDAPIELLEQHCWIDLDDDDYKEPYIVTVHKESKKILRIKSRFDKIEKNKNGEVIRILPELYFTDYHFLRPADGGFYSIGFGALLYPLNSAVNTLLNQLVDAGTLSNRQGGFLGRGLRIKDGEFALKMGEWKILDAASGTDISKNIVPIPTKEPSPTLFKLLEFLVDAGQNLSSTTDISKGQQSPQNVTQGAISTIAGERTKVFVVINQGVYRSLQKEFRKMYLCNYKYLDNDKYVQVLQDPLADKKKDFEPGTLDVYPVADPSMSSEYDRVNKASILQQLSTVDKHAADNYMLKEVIQFSESQIKALQPPKDPNAPPPPEVQKIMAQINQMNTASQAAMGKVQLMAQDNQLKMAEMQQSMKESEARIQESLARQVKMSKDAAHGDTKLMLTAQKIGAQEELKHGEFALKKDKTQADTLLSAHSQLLDEKKITAEVERTKQEANKGTPNEDK